ncbi:MAG TPA: P1 family peptidase [Acidimicrobiales bacterium]|nr:P1 family peptidase [Acidimicrobiales bacterium]
MISGVRVGHWTDPVARTGCTVVLLPAGTVASGEVRGGAPGTREWALLAPERLVSRVDAVVLSGGSAFGLAACDGVVRWCEERGIGFPTPAGPVPIVVGAVLFDLMVGDPTVRPDAAAGYAACESAAESFDVGRVGAGTGATVGKWRGGEPKPGGLGAAEESDGDLRVSAVIAVNAWGDVRTGEPVAPPPQPAVPFGNTTIGVVATNARLDKTQCLLVAQSGHDGFARALEPAHAVSDGDALVAAATGEVDAPLETVRLLASRAVERAIRSAV